MNGIHSVQTPNNYFIARDNPKGCLPEWKVSDRRIIRAIQQIMGVCLMLVPAVKLRAFFLGRVSLRL